ncbi:ribonuclease domain-containing protein [Corynebacterium tuberculostearicum]
MSKSQASKKSLPVALGGLALAVVAGYFGFDLGGDGDSSASSASSPSESAGGAKAGDADTCEMSSLPAEAKDTADDILAGGPYDYPDNDNARFGNYEGRLPQQDKNYYREYTVETPGSKNRGARRIITGGGSETDPDVWYYTDDHYESFCSIPDAEE